MQTDTKIHIKSIYITSRKMLYMLLCSDNGFTSVYIRYTQGTHRNTITKTM